MLTAIGHKDEDIAGSAFARLPSRTPLSGREELIHPAVL